MARPKESTFGLITGGYNTLKIRKLGSEFDSIAKNIDRNSTLTLSAIKTVTDLQVATLAGLHEINLELDSLSKSSWKILNELKKEDRRQEILGTLKLFLINVEEQIDFIKEMYQSYPVWATHMAEELKKMFNSKGVTIEHFKRMPSTSDIKWAKSVIKNVQELFDELYNQLGD
tara:strand:- start:394 stop:912 length:519 start_codon:yes stop_codon:yes gene_type:complete